MPTLLLHQSDQCRGVVLSGRLLIGRVAPAGLIISDPAVSRIHAWIDKAGDHYYVADADSRSGTIVDEFPIAGRHTLIDGDEIRIGAAILTYKERDQLPEGAGALSASFSNGVSMPAAGGILFACTCGAPLWAPVEWVGRRGKCNLCGERTPVPTLPPGVLPPAPAARPAAAIHQPVRSGARQCSICQWAIEPTDVEHACPSCGLTFHSECWEANKGCSAYGCASVEVLAEPASESEPIVVETVAEEPPERFPVEFAMLGGSVIFSVISLITFGVPSALLAICTSIYWVTQRRRAASLRHGIVAVAMVMCITGICAGLWFSAFRWLHRPLSAPWQHVS
jgi:predicted RNA-binding Zn-ribbon protein involved in translation (DUF1610 family)